MPDKFHVQALEFDIACLKAVKLDGQAELQRLVNIAALEQRVREMKAQIQAASS